jgi:predicted phosphate transport protein (TIGR00153 family)
MDVFGLKHILVPQEKRFFAMLEQQARIVHKGSDALNDMLKNYRNAEELAQRIEDIEHEGDDAVHEIFTELNKTFITPIDHTDISSLASAMDDVLDRMEGTASRLVLYEIKQPPQSLTRLAEVLSRQVKALNEAVSGLRERRSYGRALERCVEINRLENEADEIYRGAVAKLFKTKNAIEIMKLKEIHDIIEQATDMCEDAASVIKDIVVKHS